MISFSRSLSDIMLPTLRQVLLRACRRYNHMDCLDDNAIAAFCEGALPAAEFKQAQLHLTSCAHCRDLVQALQGCQLSPVPSPSPLIPRASDVLVGQVLSETYRLLHSLGSGGMGKVYAAEHVRLQRRVAVKLLSGELCQHPEVLERFQREARICAGLGSHHIVDVLDFNQLPDGTPYMVMEQLRGEDLAQRLTLGGRLPAAQVVAILRQVCAALACTHAEGILHRDLKPSNIFLCEETGADELLVKVLDFGISKARGSLATITHTEEILGTPAYMSPEMALARHRELDHRADLFSLGAIAYEALCGQRPFSADTIPAVLYRVVNEAPPPPHRLCPDVPRPMSRLVMDLLSKDPARRPASAEEVIRRLDQLDPLKARHAASRQLPRRTGAAASIAQAPTDFASPALQTPRPRAQTLLRSWALWGLLVLAAAAGLWLSVGGALKGPAPAAVTAPATVPAPADTAGAAPAATEVISAPAPVVSDAPPPGSLTDRQESPAGARSRSPAPPASSSQPKAAPRRPPGRDRSTSDPDRRRPSPRPRSIDPDPIL